MVADIEFRRQMARFELAKCRRGRAAVALRRAKIWRWDALARNAQAAGESK